MAVIYPIATQTARMQAVISEIGNAGKLIFYSASNATPPNQVLVTFTLATTAGTVSSVGGKAQIALSDANGAAAGILSATATNAGTAAQAKLTKADGTTVVVDGLTVGGAGSDFVIDNAVLASGQEVIVNNATITHA